MLTLDQIRTQLNKRDVNHSKVARDIGVTRNTVVRIAYGAETTYTVYKKLSDYFISKK